MGMLVLAAGDAETPGGASIKSLIGVVANSVLESILLAISGYIFARRGILNDQSKKVINNINVALFTPCLLFSGVAFELTPAKLRELFVIPVGFLVCTILSAGVAWLLGTLVGLKRGQKSFAIACAMFQNSNSLPIALLLSLIAQRTPLNWGKHDTREDMSNRGLSYMVLFSTLGIIARWSIGVKLLSQAEAEEHHDTEESTEDRDRRLAERKRTRKAPVEPLDLRRDEDSDDDDGDGSRITPATSAFYLPSGLQRRGSNRPLLSPAGEGEELGGSDGDDEESFSEKPPSFLDRVKYALWVFNRFMTAPLWSAVLSITLALLPPVQGFVAQLTPVRNAISSAGGCSIPVTLITLGAYFYTPPSAPSPDPDARPTPPLPPGEKRTIAVALVSRMIIVPAILLPIFKAFVENTDSVGRDPVFVVAGTLLIGGPPAIQLAQITSAGSGPSFERWIAKTMFVAYVFLTAPAMIFLVLVGLWISQPQGK